MYKLIGVKNINNNLLFAIQDTSDNKIDVVEEAVVLNFLKIGFKVGGIKPLEDLSDFEYSDEFYIVDDIEEEDNDYDEYESTDSEDEDEDDYLDYEFTDDEEDDLDEDDDDDSAFFGYDDDDDYVESTVSKLYSFLSEEQVKVLKMYYLWYSQSIFNTAQKDPTLGMKNKARLQAKQRDLANLRSTGGLWHYAGFIDTGYFGGGYCTLGHKLRYMHLAWDVKESDIETTFFGDNYDVDFDNILNSNNIILFGIKCITDFFEVDKECMQNLLRAQRESLKEMEDLASIYEDKKQDEVINSFGVLDDFMTHYMKMSSSKKLLEGKKYNPPIKEGYVQFYLKFKKAGMPLPKSLVQGIRDNIVGWGSHKFIGIKDLSLNVIKNTLSYVLNKSEIDGLNYYLSLGNKYYGYRNLASGINYYFHIYFYGEICGFYKYNPNSKYKDEGGASQKVISSYKSILYYLKRQFFNNYSCSVDYIKKLLTLLELAKLSENLLSNANYTINDVVLDSTSNKYVLRAVSDSVYEDKLEKYINKYCSTFSVDNRLFDKEFYNIYNKCVNKNDIMEDWVSNSKTNYFLLKDKLIEDLRGYIEAIENTELENKNNKYKLLLESQSRLQDEQVKKEDSDIKKRNKESRDMVIDKCISILGNKKIEKELNDKNPFILKILNSVSRYKCFDSVSEKQMVYLNKAYSIITGDNSPYEVVSTSHSLEPNSEVSKLLDFIINNEDKVKEEMDEYESNICISIAKTINASKHYSDKQLAHLMKVKTALNL